MTTISEVVVKAIPEGMSDVRDGLQGMNEDLEESTEQMEEQSNTLSDLSKEFDGAMGAVVAGFTVAASGLLSQVPVIGETMGALGAVLDGIAFQMDSVLRPAITRVNNLLFGLSETIFEAEGAFGNFVGIVATLGAGVIGAVAAFASAKIATLGFVAGLKATFAALLVVAKAVGAFVVGLISLPALAAAAVVGLLALAYVFRDEIREFAGKAWQAIKDFASDAIDRISTFVSNVGDKFGELVDDAKEWGASLIERLIAGIKNKASDLKQAVSGIELTAGVSIGDITGGIGDLAGGGGSSDGGSSDFIGSVGSSASKIFLDGSRVDDNQGRFRKDALNRRS